MPNVTPYVCRHTYYSNMAKSGMNPKTLQYLMGYSNIGVTLNTYMHLGLENATDELKLDFTNDLPIFPESQTYSYEIQPENLYHRL